MRALAPLVSSLTGPTALVLALIGCAPAAVHRVRELPAPAMRELPLQPVPPAPACDPVVWEEDAPAGATEISVIPGGALLLHGITDVQLRERASGKLLGQATLCRILIAVHMIDERRALVVCHDEIQHLTLANMSRRTLYHHGGSTRVAAFTAGAVALGHVVAPEVELRSLHTGGSLATIPHTLGPPRGLALSADGRLLAIGGTGVVEVVTLSTRKRTRFATTPADHEALPLRFAADPRFLVVKTDAPRSYEWRTGQEAASPAPPESSAAPECQLSGSAQRRVTCQVACRPVSR